MDLEFSDEQNMLRDAVSKFCETEYTFDKREKIVESNLGHSPDLWKQFAELGWLGMPFSEKMVVMMLVPLNYQLFLRNLVST